MAGNSIRLLLIDDDRIQHRIVAEMVRGFGPGRYVVECADNCRDGLERLTRGAFDVCLLDYSLGDGDGLGVLREARNRGVATPVVFLTAAADPAVDQLALEAGAFDYLVKQEVTPVVLERSLRYTLRLSAMLAAFHELAIHDQLTGAFNRRELDPVLAHEWVRSTRSGIPFAVVLLDVDGFKQVNDSHGHQAGDEVLRRVARGLKEDTRSVDRLFRFGGDEFAAVLVETDETTALGCARRLVERVAADGRRAPVAVTISAGVAAFDPRFKGPEDLLRAADSALYAAKGAGRNRALPWSELPGGVA